METKRCYRCKAELPLSSFPRNGKRGHGTYCKPCHNERGVIAKRAAMADPERYAKLKQKWARTNRNRRLRDGDGVRATQRQALAELKVAIMGAYGGKCECCDERNIHFLTLDHVNNDGHEHRARVGEGYASWRDLRRRGFPQEGYRVMCWNCHMATTHGRVCPHRDVT